MYPSSQAIIYVIAFLSAYVPVLVTGKPQIQLGGIWIGKVPESPKDDAPSQPPTSVSTSEGGLKVISEKPAFTGYIQLQVFLRKANSDDDGSKLVKIHDSNSTFTIPESISASVKNPARSRLRGEIYFLMAYFPSITQTSHNRKSHFPKRSSFNFSQDW